MIKVPKIMFFCQKIIILVKKEGNSLMKNSNMPVVSLILLLFQFRLQIMNGSFFDLLRNKSEKIVFSSKIKEKL